MGRRKKAEDIERTVIENLNKPAEAFANEVAYKAFTSEQFATLPPQEALDIGIALRALLEGQSVTQSMISQMNDEIAKMKARIEKMEKARRDFEEDRKRFFERTDEELERARHNVDRDRVAAEVAQKLQAEVAQARIRVESEQARLVEQLKLEPKETIVSPGEVVTISQGGSHVQKVEPEVVIIGNIPFVLPPGQPVAVPKSVADRWREMQRMKEVVAKRSKALDASTGMKPVEEIAKEWRNIESESGILGEGLPA